jgi:hypothetical protein
MSNHKRIQGIIDGLGEDDTYYKVKYSELLTFWSCERRKLLANMIRVQEGFKNEVIDFFGFLLDECR